MTTTDNAAEAVTEAVQAAATPLAFFAILGVAALAVAALVKRFGRSLPAPDYSRYFPSDDTEQEDDDEDTSDMQEYAHEQWQ